MISVFLASVLIIGVGNLSGITYAQTDSYSNNGSTGDASTVSIMTTNNTSSDSIPTLLHLSMILE
jgi:hypothetical protein